jgi:hypothetical protein
MRIYVVLGEGGIGQDRFPLILRAFRSKEAAEFYANSEDARRAAFSEGEVIDHFSVEPTELENA